MYFAENTLYTYIKYLIKIKESNTKELDLNIFIKQKSMTGELLVFDELALLIFYIAFEIDSSDCLET